MATRKLLGGSTHVVGVCGPVEFIIESIRRVSTVRPVDIDLEHSIRVWDYNVSEALCMDSKSVGGVEDGRIIPF